jgi:hypothetical protein
MAATEGPIPTAEEKNRITTAKKELIQALVKRRALDKQLVRQMMFLSNSLTEGPSYHFLGSNRSPNTLPRRTIPCRNVSAQRREHHSWI